MRNLKFQRGDIFDKTAKLTYIMRDHLSYPVTSDFYEIVYNLLI